jgi:hypothetical protein
MDAHASLDLPTPVSPLSVAERHYEQHKKAQLAYRLRKNPTMRVGQRGRPPGSKNKKTARVAENECVPSKK